MSELKFVIGSDEIDLLEGDDGFTLRLDGWMPQIARGDNGVYGDVVETITLKASGTDVNNLANIVTTYLEDKIEWISDRVNNPVSPDQDLVFLRWQMTGQPITRQALVRSLSYDLGDSPFFPPVSNQATFHRLALSVERHPFWEDSYMRTAEARSILSGGDNTTPAFSQTPRGTAPARIARVFVRGGTDLTEYWLAFRSNKYGSKDDFEPVWPFDNITTDNDATTSSSNSVDGPVATMVWSSGDSDLLERMRISLSHVTSIPAAQYRSQRGTFTILLRARSTGTETFNVRLSDGFYTDGTDSKNIRSRVRVSGTSFKFYPLGTVTIPPLPIRTTAYDLGLMGNYHLRLEAEVASSGTGNLEATRFVLIPQDEGFLHIKGVFTSSVVTHRIYTSPDDRISAFTLNSISEAVRLPTELDVINFSLPRTDSNLIMAGHGDYQNLTGTVDVFLFYYPRWLGLGGA